MNTRQTYYNYEDAFTQPALTVGRHETILARPSEKFKDEDHHTTLFVVNSTDRNTNVYPTASDYSVTFDTPIKDVVSIELINGCIPRTEYNVTSYNNQILFQETTAQRNAGLYITATVPAGQYDAISDLLSAVGTAMTAASTRSVTYVASVNSITKFVTITGTNGTADLFGLVAGIPQQYDVNATRTVYPPTSILKILGYASVSVSTPYSGASVTLAASAIYKTSGEDFVTLSLDNIPLLHSTNNSIEGGFCVIHFGDLPWGSVKHLKMSDNGSKMIKYLNPIQNIDRLRIKFKRSDGSPYGFNGQDHTLVFEIKSKFKTGDY